DADEVFLGDVGSHADLGGGLDGRLQLLGQDLGQVGVGDVGAHAGGEDDAGVGDVVVDGLGQLGKVPAVPLLGAHGVEVEVLVAVVAHLDALDDHGADLVGGELEGVAGQGVREAEGNAVHSHGAEAGDERRDVLANASEEVH